MKVIIDKQEKKPLVFKHPYVTETLVEHLGYIGDYAVRFEDGFMPPVRFERKADDLFSSLTTNYGRLKNEFDRASDAGIVLILITEYPLSKILKGHTYKRYDKELGEMVSVFQDGEPRVKQLFTMLVKNHVPFWCCKDRNEMVEYITRTFLALGEQRVREMK